MKKSLQKQFDEMAERCAKKLEDLLHAAGYSEPTQEQLDWFNDDRNHCSAAHMITPSQSKKQPLSAAPSKLTLEQFIEALHIYRERNCAYCGWLTAALHWYCTNQKAIDARGTTFPGICHCPWWKPDRDYIREQLRELPSNQKPEQ